MKIKKTKQINKTKKTPDKQNKNEKPIWEKKRGNSCEHLKVEIDVQVSLIINVIIEPYGI